MQNIDISEQQMRETYVKAYGQEYDSPNRKQTPLPLELAYKVALRKLNKQSMQTILTTEQIKSLEDKIYDCLMVMEVAGDDDNTYSLGMGEMGEAREQAQNTVSEWMEENNIIEA